MKNSRRLTVALVMATTFGFASTAFAAWECTGCYKPVGNNGWVCTDCKEVGDKADKKT